MQLRSNRLIQKRRTPDPTPKPDPKQKSQSVRQAEPSDKRNITLKEALEKLYTDIKSVPSYSAKINEFLRDNNVHSVHRRIIKKSFPRRKVISRFPFLLLISFLFEHGISFVYHTFS